MENYYISRKLRNFVKLNSKRNMKKKVIIILTILLSVSSFADNSPIKKRSGRAKAVKKIMTLMTEKQMVGQLFMVESYATWDEYQVKKIYRQIDSNYIGGVCFFKGNQKDLIRMNMAYNQRSKIPLFVAIDGEWGLGMRMTDGKTVPMAMTMGALTQDKQDLVFDMAQNLAEQCNALGININFAPDVDININPNNPVINMRSFGEDKIRVAQLGYQYFSGMQSKGVMGCVKHFPGHGDTETDSHKSTPVITHSKDFIDTVDTYPFRYAIDKNVWSVMIGHLEVKALSEDTLVPTSVNKDVINDYLIDKLDFKGLVFTDAMNMKGLTSRYGKGEAEVMAVLAGVDVILMPENLDTAVNAIIEAMNQGRIPRKLIKEKCKKILEWKYDMGLLQKDDNDNFIQRSYSLPDKNILQTADDITAQIYDNSITSVWKSNKRVENPDGDTLVFIGIGATSYDTLINNIDSRFNTVFVRLTKDTKKKDFDSILVSLPKDKPTYLLVSGGKFAKNTTYYGVPMGTFSVMKKINDNLPNHNNLVAFTNAYFLKYIDTAYNFEDILVAYENNDFTQRSIAKVLNGNLIPSGKLPVTAKKEHVNIEDEQTDETLNILNAEVYDENLLKNLNINKDAILKIDSIAENGVKEKAYPGCQMLIAKDNKILFEKNYGFLTYDSVKQVNSNTIYDIASVTKVMATTIAVMKLYERGKIDLDARIKTYLPEYKHCKFGKLTVKELLSHYSTLPATYGFWTKTLKDGELDPQLYDYNVFMDENYMRVTDSLFIKKKHLKTMRNQLKDVKLNQQQYTYSDLNFLLLQFIVEAVSGQSLDKFLQKEFYAPMNLKNTVFNPLDNNLSKENIAPTEDEKIFRKQLIHATVHDPMAALHGGVCGNAGLFSTAEDLFAICSMLMNNGEYNGVRYLQKSTIDTFNKRYFKDKNVRRALGFDKPFISSPSTHCSKYASQSSYGHSGFTGTYIWIDPDNQTIFIFLSNRVNPSVIPNKLATMNIRTDIHDLIYESLKN